MKFDSNKRGFDEQFAAGKAVDVQARYIQKAAGSIYDDLGHSSARRGRLHDAVAGKSSRKKQPVDAAAA